MGAAGPTQLSFTWGGGGLTRENNYWDQQARCLLQIMGPTFFSRSGKWAGSVADGPAAYLLEEPLFSEHQCWWGLGGTADTALLSHQTFAESIKNPSWPPLVKTREYVNCTVHWSS